MSPCALVAKIFTAIARSITPKNFLTAMSPAGLNNLSMNFRDLRTLTTIMSLKANYGETTLLVAILINLIIVYLVLRSLSTWASAKPCESEAVDAAVGELPTSPARSRWSPRPRSPSPCSSYANGQKIGAKVRLRRERCRSSSTAWSASASRAFVTSRASRPKLRRARQLHAGLAKESSSRSRLRKVDKPKG